MLPSWSTMLTDFRTIFVFALGPFLPMKVILAPGRHFVKFRVCGRPALANVQFGLCNKNQSAVIVTMHYIMEKLTLGFQSSLLKGTMGKRGKRAAKGGKKLRTESVFGGCPRAMPSSQLPLWKDVGLHLEDLEKEGMKRCEAVKKTAEKVLSIYQAATIPCLPIRSIERKIKTLLSLKRNHELAAVVDQRTGKVKDQGKRRHKKRNNRVKVKLCDVVETLLEVKTGEVPELEREFYQDQCGSRKMVIGGLDVKETKRRSSLIKKELVALKRKEKKEEGRKKLRELEERDKQLLFKKMSWDSVSVEEVTEEVGDQRGENLGDEDDVRMGTRGETWCTTGSKRRRISAEQKLFVGEFIEACDRFEVSSTAASTIYNLHASSSKSSLRVNQSQVAKLKRKLRIEKADSFKPVNQPQAIGFDERKDESKCVVGVGQSGHKRFEKKKVLFT